MAENTYTQQNYFVKICMGCTNHLSRLEARYYRTQADAWQHRAEQIEAESQDRIGWYRSRYHELKEENMRLCARLARYADLEKKLNERRG